jgi:hypothetical protein
MHKRHFLQRLFIVSTLALCGNLRAADSASVRGATLRDKPIGAEVSGPLSGPVLGYIAQTTPVELRAIVGVAGSAVLSDPLFLPKNASRLYLAPDQSYALVAFSNGDPQILPLGSSKAPTATVAGALQDADFVVFSPRGRSAILYSSKLLRLQVISGLPIAPLISQDVNTSAFLEQPLSAAISDDSASVLLTSSQSVYHLVSGGLARQFLGVNGGAALTFFPNSAQAAIADRGAGAVYLWRGDAGSATQLIGGLVGVGEMRPSSDGQGLWLACPAGNNIWWLSAKTADLRSFDVPISPSKLDGLPSADMFLISDEPGLPAWILFQQGSEARSAFIPAARGRKPRLPVVEVSR